MTFNENIDALLTALADSSSDDVEKELQFFNVNDVVAVLAKRLLDAEEAGGGGALPFALDESWQSFVGVVSIPTGPAAENFNFTTDPGITAAGAALLDTTDPASPTFVAEGIYAVTFTCGPDSGTEVGKHCTMSVKIDFAEAQQPLSYQSFLLDSGESGTLGWVGITNYVEAGTVLHCRILHDVGADTDFDVSVYIQRLA